MFSLFGTQGRLFSGSLEELHGVPGLRRVRRPAADARDFRDSVHPDAAAAEPGTDRHRQALAAYAQTRQPVHARQPLTQVQDLMSRAVVPVTADSTLAAAWQTLGQRGLSQAPVVDGAGRLVGLLSFPHLLRPGQLPAAELALSAVGVWMAQRVQEVMWTPVPAVEPQTDVRRVARLLFDTGLQGLPVTDPAGALCGFIARSDLVRAVANDPPLDLWS